MKQLNQSPTINVHNDERQDTLKALRQQLSLSDFSTATLHWPSRSYRYLPERDRLLRILNFSLVKELINIYGKYQTYPGSILLEAITGWIWKGPLTEGIWYSKKKGKTTISFAVIGHGSRIAPLMKSMPLLGNTSSLSTLLIVYSWNCSTFKPQDTAKQLIYQRLFFFSNAVAPCSP